MNALKVFNIIYGLKKIEELDLYEKLGIENDKCRFSYLLELANENKDELLTSTIKNDVLDYFHDKDTLRKFLFYEIPINIKCKAFCHLVKQINSISDIEKSCNVQLSGKIYEYFIGRDESAISELGAYFTDRHIVNYIYDKINIETNDDGSIPSMIDMFGGSGGFTTGYIHYLNQKYNSSESEESKDYKINWSTELSKVHHYDMNEDVIKSAGLEFLCLTKELPDMNNLKYKNSFSDEFNDQKFSYIVTNPPYAGDKTKKTDANNKMEKIKLYILNELKNPEFSKNSEKVTQRKAQLKSIEAQEKQDKLDSEKAKVCLESCSTRINKYAREHKLKGTDKEACSLILMMDLLAENGTAVGVLKEGVFFDKSYKDLRACLIKNFNVTEVISVPQDQFENTSTKTSIIIFKNEVSKTSEVKFYDLIVEK
jgi:type I restriction-modification system DNA methylase subunit